MLSIAVQSYGPLKQSRYPNDRNKELQETLIKAGYRVNPDGYFGPRTFQVVERFQQQHKIPVTGIVDVSTAALLDQSGEALVNKAIPLVVSADAGRWPHDDTASLLNYYGDPRDNLAKWKDKNVTTVKCPWSLYYDGNLWPHEVQFHRLAADGLAKAFDTIWKAAGEDDKSPLLKHVRNFSGSGEFRTVRGSGRLSCHAFWVAIDFDADHLPLGHGVAVSEMPEPIVQAFLDAGAFWGGNYTGRKDPMHFQWAHE